MVTLLFELLSAVIWLGFMVTVMLFLVALRLTAWALAPIIRAIAGSFRGESAKEGQNRLP